MRFHFAASSRAAAFAVGFCILVAGPSLAAAKPFPAPPASANATSYAGTWNGTYVSNLVQPTTVTLIFQQRGTTVTGTYLTRNGAQGVIYGPSGTGPSATLKATQTTPTCPGTFTMQTTVSGNRLSWTFVGHDCLGNENGKGTATHS